MIIVTGGTGMLGAHILFKLTENHSEITAFKRFGSDTSYTEKIFSFYDKDYKKRFNRIFWEDCDITDSECSEAHIKPGSTIIHAAAAVSFKKKDKARVREVNVSGTENIVNIALRKGVKKFCHISSTAALSKSEKGQLTDESPGDLNKNASEYSKSKYYAEMEVWRAISEGLNAVIVNPSVIIGPGHPDKGSGPLFRTAYNNNPFYTEGITGFTDVNDTAEIIIRLCQSDISGERFVINGDNLSYKQLFEILAKNLNSKPPKIKVNKSMLKTVSAISGALAFISGRDNKISKEIVYAAFSKTRYSNEKIRKRLNFEFTDPGKSVKKYAPFFLKEFTQNS